MSPSPDHLDSDDTLHRRAADELASYALGEPLAPELAAHVETCDRCRDELEAYRATVTRAQALGPSGEPLAEPPPGLWSRIEAEVSDVPSAGPPPGDDLAARRHRSPGARRVTLSLLAAAAVVAAGSVGWALGHRSASTNPGLASAQLAAQRGTAAGAHGRATMQSSTDGFAMHVTTAGLPAPHGYYEVWLYDPSINRMVAIGTLGTDASGTFTVPAGIDTRAYHVVDVSDQRYNGDPSHQTSVLRGALTQ